MHWHTHDHRCESVDGDAEGARRGLRARGCRLPRTRRPGAVLPLRRMRRMPHRAGRPHLVAPAATARRRV